MQIDTVVIGAGQAGLGMSWALREAGISHVVLERGRIGESWRSQRWESFCLNTPNRYNGLPGAPYAGEEPDGFMPCREVVEYFGSYARRFDLPVRDGADVVRVSATDDGFEVALRDGEKFACRNVVVASGAASTPHVPAVANGLSDEIAQLHTAEYRSPDALAPGGVLVVGSGQSGVQIAEDLVEAGRQTWLCTSAVGRGIRRYRGRDLFDWMAGAGLLRQTIADLEDPAQAKMTQPQISGTKGGHTVALQSLARQGVHLLGSFARADGAMLEIAGNLMENAALGDGFSAQIKGMIDQAIEKMGLEVPAAEPDPAEAPFEGMAQMAERRTLDLREEGIGTVIWATGFRGDFSYLDVPALDDEGRPEHEGGISKVPGLYFLGLPWLRTRASGLLTGIDADARSMVEHLRARGG